MKFSVENFKGVKGVEISASQGDMVIVAGKNGAGKSSFIDAITELFDSRGTKLTPKPIRDGEKKAVAEFTDPDLDIRVRRTWTKDDAGKLEVYALDGAKYGKPSDVLAKLTGGLIFDPGRFLTLDEKKQRDELLAKVELPFDLDQLDRQKEGAKERRLEAGRDVKRLTGALASLPEPDKDTPDEEVSVADLTEALLAGEQAHRDALQRDEAHGYAVEAVERYTAEIEALKEKLAAAEAERAKIEFEDATAEALPDLDVLRANLGAVSETNQKVRDKQRWQEVKEELEAAQSAHEDAEKTLAGIEAKKVDGLASVEWPDPELGLDEEGVTLAGIPFKQVNTARKILAAARIATSGDPTLKLVIISNGDLLDEDSLAMVQKLAAERGFTILAERDRDESRDIGFEIREGSLVE